MIGQELPRYRCHKEVRAAKLLEVIPAPMGSAFGAVLIPEGNCPVITVDTAYVLKHRPQAGGYFVLYDDGYQSWSPANAVEEGYTLIS